jgi:hypothetical protein
MLFLDLFVDIGNFEKLIQGAEFHPAALDDIRGGFGLNSCRHFGHELLPGHERDLQVDVVFLGPCFGEVHAGLVTGAEKLVGPVDELGSLGQNRRRSYCHGACGKGSRGNELASSQAGWLVLHKLPSFYGTCLAHTSGTSRDVNFLNKALQRTQRHKAAIM